jgi:hypothetical protein
MQLFGKRLIPAAGLVLVLLLNAACERSGQETLALEVPRGFVSEIRVEDGDRILGFGPFVGYYFRPQNPGDLTRLEFVCFNERSFYTRDLPENAKLFEGKAVLTRLPDTGFQIPDSDRINPVFFPDAPEQWLATRPEPKDAYVHFHSCYDARGPVLTGYWIRHEGMASFTYDMGGRVGPDSPLFHEVSPGIDHDFARIIEFDHGPA